MIVYNIKTKTLKYLIFLSILIGTFLTIYSQYDEKGFCRLLTSLKMATFVAAIVSGLIAIRTEAIKPSVNNNNN